MVDHELILSLVTSHLEKVTPGLAEEFKSLYPSRTLTGSVSVEEIVRHYERTAPDRRRLILARRIVESKWELEEIVTRGRDITMTAVEANNVFNIQSDSSSDDSEDQTGNAEEDSIDGSTSQKKDSSSGDESSGSEVEPDPATTSSSTAQKIKVQSIDTSTSDSSSDEDTPVVSKPQGQASSPETARDMTTSTTESSSKHSAASGQKTSSNEKARVSKKLFSEKEDEVLLRAINQGKEKYVAKLAKKLNRAETSVRNRIMKLKTGTALRTHRRFTAEEDKVLLEAIREGKEGDVVRLAETLDRNQTSVSVRIKKLKLTGEGRVTAKRYTLEEDMVIMDAAVEQYKEVESLKDITLSQAIIESLSQDLRKQDRSVYQRWEHYLKVWLLGYYSKTLNKEVRLLLANLLVDRFETVVSIDWDQVIGYQEFSGHTKTSLKRLLRYNLMLAASRHFKIPKSNITLKQIADVAKIKYSDGMKVPDKLRKRQDDIIKYWEGLC